MPGIFSTRMEGPRTHGEIDRENAYRKELAKPPKKNEHMASVVDLHDYLEKNGHAEACATAYSCDPWKYEPLLMDDLIKARIANDQKKQLEVRKLLHDNSINEIRGLIRAGSWMSYERTSMQEIEARLEEIRAQEEAAWNWKIRQADPDTSKELKANLEEVEGVLRKIRLALDQNLIGDDLEEATRLVEDLSGRLWLQLKQPMAAHGIPASAVAEDHLTKTYHREIERLRPIRDLLYYRRLYPNQARRSINATSSPYKTPPAQ